MNGVSTSLSDSRMAVDSFGNVEVQNNVTAVGYTSTSDTRIKTDQEQVPPDDCQRIFDAVEVTKYTRTDIEQQRVGFIAQDLDAVCKNEFACIVGRLQPAVLPTDEVAEIQEEPLLTVDYSRLVTVLWGVCKNLHGRVAQLEQAASSSRNNASSAETFSRT